MRPALFALSLVGSLAISEAAHAETWVGGGAQPVGDAVLAASYGAGLQRTVRIRHAADDLQLIQFRDNAQIGQVTMDNWWAQIGNVLIASNLLEGR